MKQTPKEAKRKSKTQLISKNSLLDNNTEEKVVKKKSGFSWFGGTEKKSIENNEDSHTKRMQGNMTPQATQKK